MLEFYKTVAGRKFFERDVPKVVEAVEQISALIKSMDTLANALNRHSDLMEKAQATDNTNKT